MDSLCVMFAPAIEKYTIGLLARIALDYNLPSEELIAKYMSRPEALKPGALKVRKPRVPKEPKEPSEPKIPCIGLTGKKTPCKNKCINGSDKCHLHSAILPGGDPKPPRVPKIKKVKEQPAHNHKPLVAPDEPCQLCETHGDATNPGLPQIPFVPVGMSMQERLAAIINSGSEDDDDEMTEDEIEDCPESPGAFRNRMILAERSQVPGGGDDDDEMTEDEFEEEELEE